MAVPCGDNTDSWDASYTITTALSITLRPLCGNLENRQQ
jgi:hypothetical protein